MWVIWCWVRSEWQINALPHCVYLKGFLPILTFLCLHRLDELLKSPTYLTLLFFLWILNSPLLNKFWRLIRSFTVLTAIISLLSRMNTLLQRKTWYLIKGSSTFTTFRIPVWRFTSLMFHKVWVSFNITPSFIAWIPSHTIMNTLVIVQAGALI